MIRRLNIGWIPVLVLILISVPACDSPPPPPQKTVPPKVVSKAMPAPPVPKPEAAANRSKEAPSVPPDQASQDVPAAVPRPVPEPGPGAPVSAPEQKAPPLTVPENIQKAAGGEQAPVPETLVKRESEMAAAVGKPEADKQMDDVIPEDKMAHTETYDPGGRVDPFLPLIKTEKKVVEKKAVSKPEAPKRILTPLEKMDLSEIKLVAVVITENTALAMVEEATGKGYEVRLGTYMGQNGGQVTEIYSGGIVVKEVLTDYKGKRSERFQEIKMRKNENGE